MKAKKTIMIVAAMLLVAALSIAGTIAYLTSTTGEVTNTFTVGDIEITLDEGTWDDETKTLDSDTRIMANSYHLFPGSTYGKDPIVTVKAGSEDCWLFVKVVEPDTDILTYALEFDAEDSPWTKLEDGVYYMAVSSSEEAQAWHLIVDDEVSVASDVDDLTDAAEAVLTFQAYAIQQENLTAAQGWAALNPAPAAEE